jgi:UDP-N-acetylglucosamine diphosphorylase / glucose-1-phosphate thymidylyltransferase / UDP-N-acetylgalactosamine diphosphorylase / glucosamine-1-phosphate N-acetyltransferase / galactosamine-1-phosphate N-acetyltransferase
MSLSRPVFSLLSGRYTLLEKQVRHLSPSRVTLWVRPELEAHCRQRVAPKLRVPVKINEPLDEEPALLVSGRTLHMRKYRLPEKAPEEWAVVEFGESVRKAYVKRPGLSQHDMFERTGRWLDLMALPRMEGQARSVESPWDLISWNEESLIEDSTHFHGKPRPRDPSSGTSVHYKNDEDIWLGEGVSLQPGCVLDASKGPIMISDRVSIGANSVIQGPCAIGQYSSLKPLTQIRAGTSIGRMCRIGGEVSNSIFLGDTNKSHEGFVGDSYIGKWVNLGAGTTTSNMKNTHGEINIQMGEKSIPTGRRFLGSLIGDHSKTSILTRLQSGTYIGFCSLLAGSTVAPKFIPSYTFWSDRKTEPYRLEKAIEVLQGVFGRRDRAWTEMDERMMHYIKEISPAVEQG